MSPQQTKALQNQLAALISQELASARELQLLLEQEQTALKGPDHEAIEALSSSKKLLIEAMQNQLKNRGDFLSQLSLPPGNQGTNLFIQKLSGSTNLNLQWEELQQTAAKLKAMNEVNGHIIAQSQRQTRQALDILTGNQASPDTYGPDGEGEANRLPSSLAKA
ncbi:MAG: flagellar protein FlgN [Gammaproteobacteria bacterium]|nr:flagellar protein FlgN [Gammaproteobacteria bacterium]